MLPLQAVQPCSLPWTSELKLSLLRQFQVVRSMRPPSALHLPTREECLQPILADGCQHEQAQFPSFLLQLAQQALVHERRNFVQHACWHLTESSRETLHRIQRAATSKDREPSEELLLLGVE